MAEERAQRRRERPRSTWRALLWTAASVPVPGIAHLRMGRRWSGGLILGCYLLVLAALTAAALHLGGDLRRSMRYVVQESWLIGAGATAFALCVLWMTVVVHSYVITRPPRAHWAGRWTAALVVTALCVVVAAPAAAVMRTAHTAYDALSSVFGPEPTRPVDAADPWEGRDRVNVLLLGGDAGDNRYGMRTDSMMVASIDVEYGDVVLVGLPRNLENVPFPEGTALAERYPEPHGFDDLLNEVYQTVADDPAALAIDPVAEDPAADTLRRTIGYAIGVDIDHYALVDMRGFQDLIDAIGGIDVHIEEPIPYGIEGDVLEPGMRHLNGYEALWYGRSRVNSDDYTRMGRQGCLIKYVAEQADPGRILAGFQDLAGATKRTLKTDIPQSRVMHFVDLAELVGDGTMRTLQLSPPQVNTAYPDWEEIRDMVADAIQEQEDAQSADGSEEMDALPSPEGSPAPSPSAPEDGSTEWQEYTGLPEPSPTTPGRQVGDEATSLDALCP
ncbi:LCP family protein [Marinitenerispora sediminis]|uniref:LytR family transcriptional regulator n=1 Tax=Marinitenerispora sediminis TaxID=1931232 RepID=A0A368T5W5_9ACTN|nr:LCP family protein [Marinitenerispora sediminis]RCV57441.1 LytR family transcriptional regulator [Marinitenerispora sediminis]RCV58800.1 LytR family transcriptional regulator [Marinitenerispora sediminis]RCV61283.1 LytR family transcriptional regulator [Marinitenerispora sediminis]